MRGYPVNMFITAVKLNFDLSMRIKLPPERRRREKRVPLRKRCFDREKHPSAADGRNDFITVGLIGA